MCFHIHEEKNEAPKSEPFPVFGLGRDDEFADDGNSHSIAVA
jgi:hypothetical protein